MDSFGIFKLVIVVILFVFIVFCLFIFLHYSFNKSSIDAKNDKLAKKLANNSVQALLNGSGINNIPNLNIVTNHPAVGTANACGSGPVNIGKSGTDLDCIRTCANANASVLNVGPDDVFVFNSTVLGSGAAYCIIGPRPMCNMQTSMAMMTINSVVCRTKYPNLVGGPLGTTVVACNNKQINDPQNILWDYRYNKIFDPLSTDLTNEDELLEDGSFRFRCKFNGSDIRKNRYVQHPNNRFHPFRNYCASAIVAAHPNVRTVLNATGTDFECDCGDVNETRVQNLDPNDKRSICSNIALNDRLDIKERHLLTIPYRCFTLFSALEDVGKYLPCPNDQFTRDGSHFSSVTIPYSTNTQALIEHPEYEHMSANPTVFISDGLQVV